MCPEVARSWRALLHPKVAWSQRSWWCPAVARLGKSPGPPEVVPMWSSLWRLEVAQWWRSRWHIEVAQLGSSLWHPCRGGTHGDHCSAFEVQQYHGVAQWGVHCGSPRDGGSGWGLEGGQGM